MGRGALRTVADDCPIARVLAVDDHPPFLAVVRELLRATRYLEIVGEAGSGEDAIETARRLRPDVVLMDVRMPGLGGIAAAKLIKERRPSTLIVLISTGHRDELPLDGTDTFVDAFIRKSDLGPKLLDQLWTRHLDPT